MQATVLSIAGSDPTGGAGIQADLKTMTSIGVYGAAAVTCVTVQNSHGVDYVECLPAELVYRQIQAVLDDHEVTHVKIGMVGSFAIAQAVCEALTEFRGEIIYDPVMLATTGQPLAKEDACNDLSALMASRCTVLTPNIPELEKLSGIRVEDYRDVLRPAGLLLARHRNLRLVLIKGGHAVADGTITDTMVHRADDAPCATSISHPSVTSRNTHGTGCTLAAAFASYHCLSRDDRYSFAQSVEYVQAILSNSAEVQLVKNPRGLGGMLHYSYRRGNGTD